MTGVPRVQRMLEALDICYARFHKRALVEHPETRDPHTGLFPCEWVLDLSQDAARKAHAPLIRSMCANSLFFDFGSDRVLHPAEHLVALGWPHDVVQGVGLSPSSVRDLAGESMSPPCIGLAVMALSTALLPDA